MPQLFVPILVNDEIGKARHNSLFSVTGKTLENSSGSNSDINGYDGYGSEFISVLDKKLKNCFPNESFSFNVYEYGKNPKDGVLENFTGNTTSISLGILCSAYVIKEARNLKDKYDSITVTGNFNVIDGRLSLSEVTDIGEKYKAVQDYASKNANKKHLFVYISSEEIIPDGIQENNVHVIRYDSTFPAECVFAEVFEDTKKDNSPSQKYRNDFIETRSFIELKKDFVKNTSCNSYIIKGKSNTGKSMAAEALCKYLVNSRLISDYVWFYVGDNGKLLDFLRKEREEQTNINFEGNHKKKNCVKEAYPKIFDEFDRMLHTDKHCAIIIDNIEYDIVDEILSFFNRNYPIENNKYVLIITSWEGIRINRIECSIKTLTINNELDDKELKAIVDSVLKVNDYSKKYSEATENSKNELLKLLSRLCRNYPGYIPLVLSALKEYSMTETLNLYKEKDESDLSAIDKILIITFSTMDFLSRIVLFAYLQIKKFDDALKRSEIIDILKKNMFNSTAVIDDYDIIRSLNVLQQYSFLRERDVGYYEIKNAVLDFVVFSKDISDELKIARDLIISPEIKVEYAIEEKNFNEFTLYIDKITEKETLNKMLIKLCKSDSSLEFFQSLLKKDVDLNYIHKSESPLQIYVRNSKDTRVLDFLISKGADWKARGYAGMPFLHYAAMNVNSILLKHILEHHYYDDINETVNDGLTLLHRACANSTDTKSLELLLKSGSEKYARTGSGKTLLHFAAKNKDSTMLRYILEHHCYDDINKTDDKGITPLHLACGYSKDIKAIELLLKNGAEKDARTNKGWTLLHFAARNKDSTILRYILEHHYYDDINETDNDGAAALFHAQTLDSFKLLLKYGAAPEIVTPKGNNILHAAVVNDYPEIVRYILKNLPMVDPMLKNSDGKTPADFAKSDGIKKLFEKL